MTTKVKVLKAKSVKATNKLKVENSKTEKVYSETELKAISNSLKDSSDAELLKDLSDINIESVILKTALNRSIWNEKAKSNFGSTEKSARRKLRKMQVDLSKSVLRELLLKNVDNARLNAKTLKKFYSDNLVEFAIYSNVSIETNPDTYKILHTAYSKMKQLLSL